jgi:hypothetical protein
MQIPYIKRPIIRVSMVVIWTSIIESIMKIAIKYSVFFLLKFYKKNLLKRAPKIPPKGIIPISID